MTGFLGESQQDMEYGWSEREERAGFRIERELLFNEARDGPITGPLRWLRANGFVVVGRKGSE